jgi:hypothetical protein
MAGEAGSAPAVQIQAPKFVSQHSSAHNLGRPHKTCTAAKDAPYFGESAESALRAKA